MEEQKKEPEIMYDDLSRRQVRSLIFHLIYAVESFNYEDSLASIVDNFNRGFNLDIPQESEVVKISQEVIDKRDELDKKIEPFLRNWRFERIGLCTKLILRFAFWELLYTDTDYKIIINEAIELSKCFSEKDAYRFVNGILDEAVKQIRPETVA